MKIKSERKVSIIVVLAVISLISILAINAIATAIENRKLTEQINGQSESKSSLDEGIAELSNKNKSENEEAQLENAARDEGYIYQDEIVYADSAN